MQNTNKLAENILYKAIRLGASDIHIEPREDTCVIRARIDGLLELIEQLPMQYHSTIITQLKVQSNMDIAEKRIPQDGRWSIRMDNETVDLRLSSLPTIYGEKIVVRVLPRDTNFLSLEDLNFTETNLELFQNIYNRSHGLVLITGPTGSGKSTTLYATLSKLNQSTSNIITVENPVEYRISGINQVNVNRKAGLDFASGLRAIVRQDPDIIMIGEIRDRETASMAVQAALTGHLVLSTLHTNTACGAVNRLLDMGCEQYLVASALRGVVAQRLVRRLCPHCRSFDTATGAELHYLGLSDHAAIKTWHANGCEHCRGTGYKGRIALHEILPASNQLSDIIVKGKGEDALQSYCEQMGAHSLYSDGCAKAISGFTTLQELWRTGIRQEEKVNA